MTELYSFTMKEIGGGMRSLGDYRGKVLLFVNLASRCGNTPQYKGLEEAYRSFHSQGFEILGFPANNFGAQEPGSDAEIREFCSLNYGVSFPLFSKISVKGPDIHPLFAYLCSRPGFEGPVTWNFGKILVDREGKVIARIEPGKDIQSPEAMKILKAAL